MVSLFITPRTLPAYRHSYLVNEKTWITTRTPLYYLDLAGTNEIMFDMQFKKLFPNNRVETGNLGTLKVSKKQRFHHDDISVGCDGRRDCIYTYAIANNRKVDKIGIGVFLDFLRSLNEGAPSLTSGKKAAQFLNLAKLIGYPQWRERILLPHRNVRHSQLFVDHIFYMIYPSILKGVYEQKSEYPLLVKKLWDLFCITDQTQLLFFMDVPDAEHLKFILEEANKIKFEFWGMRFSGKGLTEQVLKYYVKEKRFDLIALLLDYGFTFGECAPENMDETWFSGHNPLTDVFPDHTDKEILHNRIMVQFLVKCYESCSNLIELPGFIEVFRKVSRTLPLPSQSPSFVRKILLDHSSHAAVEEMTAIYKTSQVHPSDISGVAPQTLSHLSRCVIRNRLAANYQLPSAIADSHLPILIKSFLRLDF